MSAAISITPRVVVSSRLGDRRLRIASSARPPWRLILLAAALVPTFRRWLDWDCGNGECTEAHRRLAPACAERIGEREEEAHVRASRRGDPEAGAVARFERWHEQHLDFIDARVAPSPARGPYRRRSRAVAERTPKPRVHVPLTKTDERAALAALQRRPIRKGIDRMEWISEVWIELVNPPENAKAVTCLDERIERAVWRVEKKTQIRCSEVCRNWSFIF